MSIRTKIIGAIVATALVAPPAFAVEGSDGMHYTSASEGFYASIRARFNSGPNDGDNAQIQNSSSRLGVQGTSEMSHGLEGFYRYETSLSTENGAAFGNTRLAYVGIRGGFGSFNIGSDWTNEYNWVYGSTDIANVNSGNFAYNDDYPGRASRSVYYKSPDFNGLQVGFRAEMDGGNDNTQETAGNGTMVDDSELDSWALSGKYSFSGFTLAGMYLTRPDYIRVIEENAMPGAATQVEDKSAWAIGGSYGQDNWNVAAWYGQNNASDYGYHYEAESTDADGATVPASWTKKSDETVFSIAGNVSVGNSGVYVVHETKENLVSQDDSATAFGVEYRFNSKSKTWIEYAGRDYDSNPGAEDYVTVGFRHDF